MVSRPNAPNACGITASAHWSDYHSHMHQQDRRISASTPLYDHAGEKLGTCNRQRAEELMTRADVIVLGAGKRVLGIRFLGPDAAHLELSGSHHKRQAGMPHTHENYFNPKGVWHIDRIPGNWRKHYLAVVADCQSRMA